MPKLKIEMSQHGKGRVYLDGVEQQQVRSVKLSVGVDEQNVAELGMICSAIEIDGEFDVTPLNHSGVRIFRHPKQCSYPNGYFAGGLR